jgi:hypothetical protein
MIQDSTSDCCACVVRERNDVGTHSSFIGSVINADAGEKAPLSYCDAKYTNLMVARVALDASARPADSSIWCCERRRANARGTGGKKAER